MKSMANAMFFRANAAAFLVASAFAPTTKACTGITLHSEDGAVVQARTMEWGSFDMDSELLVIPRGFEFTGVTPDGNDGLKWKAGYGVVGINGLGRPIYTDGMNEKGLAVSVLYLPGFAKYQPYDPEKANASISQTQVSNWLLTSCGSIVGRSGEAA